MNDAIFNPTKPVTVTDSTGNPLLRDRAGSTIGAQPVALAEADPGLRRRRTVRSANFGGLRPGDGPHGAGQRRRRQVQRPAAGVYLPRIESRRVPCAAGCAPDRSREPVQDVAGHADATRGSSPACTTSTSWGCTSSRNPGSRSTGRGPELPHRCHRLQQPEQRRRAGDPAIVPDDERWISFITRANYGYKQRYFLTGVVRRDGRSAFGAAHKWATFPGISASWRLSRRHSCQAVRSPTCACASGMGWSATPAFRPIVVVTLEATGGAKYVFGDQPVVGFAPCANPNPEVRFEKTRRSTVPSTSASSTIASRAASSTTSRIRGPAAHVPVPQPALVPTQSQNVGEARNTRPRDSLDAVAMSRPGDDLARRARLRDDRTRWSISALQLHHHGRRQRAGSERSGVPAHHAWSTARHVLRAPLLRMGRSGSPVVPCASTTPGCINGHDHDSAASDYADHRQRQSGLHPRRAQHGELGPVRLQRQCGASFGQDVFNNTALVYSTKGNALQDKNFLRPALTDPTGIHEPAIFSSRLDRKRRRSCGCKTSRSGYIWPARCSPRSARSARVYLSATTCCSLTGYSGLDPEVHADVGLAIRRHRLLSYPGPAR